MANMASKSRSVTSAPGSLPESGSSKKDISSFLEAARETPTNPGGRLIFALDATMSRQPTWDRACQIQASMFETAAKTSGLAVQLVYFRGFGECRASKWVMSGAALAGLMTKIDCRGGTTQIDKVLTHATKETRQNKVAAIVYIGDAMEEDVDKLCAQAGKLGLLGVKAFVFQEGRDPVTESAFREIARLTNGAFMRLSGNSAGELEDLLRAVAAYATGGQAALLSHGGKNAKLLIEQIRR